MKNWTIRPATCDDISAITRIYNHAVLTTVAAFDIREKTAVEQEDWFSHHGERHPVLVADTGGDIAGWAALSAWSDRSAYDDTAEVSLYIDEPYQRRGIGRALMAAIIQAGEESGLHSLISRIAEGNDVSVRLTEAMGFRHIGVMHEAGYKFGKRLDVYLLEKLLGSTGNPGA